MRYLGLDIGEARIGVAVSDPAGRVATPVEVLDARRLKGDPEPLKRLVDDYEPAMLVVGLPIGMGGEEGPQARSVRQSAERYSVVTGLPVEYWDERLSSVEVKRVMAESGVNDRKKRGTVDKLAAAVILQSYLDAHMPREAKEDQDE